MRIDCPRCHGTAITRRRRRGIFDRIRAYFGRWPYRCRSCGARFYAGQRYVPRNGSKNRTVRSSGRAAQGLQGPQMAYWSDPVCASAKIVIRTDTESQLNEILLALTSAVESCRQRAHQHAQAGG